MNLPPTVPSQSAVSRRLLDVKGLRVERRRGDRSETIVSAIDFAIADGETIGIVGESGSGKSMTARALIGLLPRTLSASGEVHYAGRNLLDLSERDLRRVRGREIGLILQDPFTMLNPVMRCGGILAESLPSNRRLSRNERRADAVLRLAEIGISDEGCVDSYPFELSGGMLQRVAIAASLAGDPRLLIADEPCTALDATTQREILSLLKRIQMARGMGLILITHDLRVAFAMCDRIYVLYAGALLEVASAAELEQEPLHPYSHGLLLSEPPADQRIRELVAIPGSAPSPDEVSGICAFAPRCSWATDTCRAGVPALAEVAPGHHSACVRLADIRGEMATLRRRMTERAELPQIRRSPRPLLRVSSVCKVFRTGNRALTALDDVSIEIGEGESVGLVGGSGAGKTTLARILVGLEHATAGGITVGGVEIHDWSKLSGTARRSIRSTIQIVFQDPYSSLNPMRSVGWTLTEAITTHNAKATRLAARIGELLEAVGLPTAYAERKPVALSGGERQRVAIARALAANPRILICDEPVSALDASVQAQILRLFATLRAERGIGYLFITHDLSVVRQMTERLYVLHRGRVVEEGTTEQLLIEPRDPHTIDLIRSIPRAGVDWLKPATTTTL